MLEENWGGLGQKSLETQRGPGLISNLPALTLSCIRSLHLALKFQTDPRVLPLLSLAKS